MQRSLPEWLCFRRCWDLLVWCAVYCATLPALGLETQGTYDPFESPTTLGANVAGPDLLWQSTMKGYLSESTGLSLPRPQTSVSLPAERAPLVISDRPQTVEREATATPSSPSPFRKWITPRAASPITPTEPDDHVSRTPSALLAPDRTPDGPALVIPDQEPAVPEVARRTVPRQSLSHSRSSQNAPSPSTAQRLQKTAPAAPPTERSSRVEEQATPLELAPRTPQEPAAEPENRSLPPLSRSQQSLRTQVRRVLNYYYDHPMNTRDRSPWEVMHVALSYESKSRLLVGGPTGKPVSAAAWLCYNQPCRNMRLMYLDDEGELQVRSAPAFQGHEGQLLAMLAQAKIPSDYPMQVDGRDLTVKDLIRAEMRTCYPRTELTFKLIGFMYYLDAETRWVNDQGMSWDIRKVITEEMRQPIRGATCGGTHRLSGLTLSYKTRQARGEPVDGEYLAAQRFVAQYQLQAYRLQNPDGSFSTNWFQGKENRDDLDRQLRTTGHVLEWLLYSATDRELNNSRTTRAVYFLSKLLWDNRYRDWDAGILGHSLHSLVLYDRMKFSPYDAASNSPVAVRDSTPSGRRGSR